MAFLCRLSSPAGPFFNGEVWQVSLPSENGMFCIRSGHIPVVTILKKGIVEIAKSENDRIRFSVTSGIALHDTTGGCRIICEKVIRAEDRESR